MNTIVVALSLSGDQGPLLLAAERLAEAFDATVYLLHVEPPEPDFVGYGPGPQHVRDNVARETQSHHGVLHECRSALRSRGVVAESLIIQGPTVEKVVEEARRIECSYLVVGSHGRGALHDLFWGNVAEGVIRKAPCPVVVVPTG